MNIVNWTLANQPAALSILASLLFLLILIRTVLSRSTSKLERKAGLAINAALFIGAASTFVALQHFKVGVGKACLVGASIAFILLILVEVSVKRDSVRS